MNNTTEMSFDGCLYPKLWQLKPKPWQRLHHVPNCNLNSVYLEVNGIVALFWYCLHRDPIEVYLNSHWAPVLAKILSDLRYFTERSCLVTQGETDGEEASKEVSLALVFIALTPVFSLARLVRFTLHVPSFNIKLSSMWVVVDPPLPSHFFHRPPLLHAAIYYWNQSSTPLPLPPPPLFPKPSPKPSPGPRTPAPTTGVELCMVGFSEKEDSPQSRPWPT